MFFFYLAFVTGMSMLTILGLGVFGLTFVVDFPHIILAVLIAVFWIVTYRMIWGDPNIYFDEKPEDDDEEV